VPKNEDGEFELILGKPAVTKCVLHRRCAARRFFFTMGYIVGAELGASDGYGCRGAEAGDEAAGCGLRGPAAVAACPRSRKTPASQPVSTAQQKTAGACEAGAGESGKAHCCGGDGAAGFLGRRICNSPRSRRTMRMSTSTCFARTDSRRSRQKCRRSRACFEFWSGPIKDGDMNKTRGGSTEQELFRAIWPSKRTF